MPGIVLLLWCVREFYVAGRGTLAPWSPPRHLVERGCTLFTESDVHRGGVGAVGLGPGFHSRAIAVYALLVMLAFHLRVILGEEPWLARTHGEAWVRYKAQVPRWLGFHRQIDTGKLAGHSGPVWAGSPEAMPEESLIIWYPRVGCPTAQHTGAARASARANRRRRRELETSPHHG